MKKKKEKKTYRKKQFRDLGSVKAELTNLYNEQKNSEISSNKAKELRDTLKQIMKCLDLMWHQRADAEEEHLELALEELEG